MESAVRSVLRNESGCQKAAKAHRVPITSLKRFVKKIRDEVSINSYFFPQIFQYTFSSELRLRLFVDVGRSRSRIFSSCGSRFRAKANFAGFHRRRAC